MAKFASAGMVFAAETTEPQAQKNSTKNLHECSCSGIAHYDKLLLFQEKTADILVAGFRVGEANRAIVVLPKIADADGSYNLSWQDEPCQVLVLDRNTNLALIEFPAAAAGDYFAVPKNGDFSCGQALKSPTPAQQVCAIGFGNTEKPTHIVGLIAGAEKLYRGYILPVQLLRLHMPPKLALPGAPLINAENKLIGVILGKIPDAKNVFYAAPAALVAKIIADFDNHGELMTNRLGIQIDTNTTLPSVLEVAADSPAAQADIRKGDLILAIDNCKLADFYSLFNYFYYLPKGKVCKLKILRDLQIIETELVVDCK